MKSLKQIAAILAGIFLLVSCAKELSVETQSATAVAAMGDTAGCYPIIIRGQFIRDSVLSDSSYILVKLNVSFPGPYTISTDQNNGFYFADTGVLVNTGLQYIKLHAIGRPITSTLTPFALTLNGLTGCSFEVQVTDSAVYHAVYSLRDNTGNCMSDTATGTYERGTPLNSTNTVMVNVNVQFPGLYTITAGPKNGMTFHASGSFVSTGVQPVILTGVGTPDTSGAITFVMEGDTSTCQFTINVDAVDYFPTTDSSYWTYQVSTTLDTTRTTVLTGSKTISGNTYKQFSAVSPVYGSDTFYYRKASGNYYEYGNMNPPPPLQIYDTVYGAQEFIFLKDYVSTGTTWETDSLRSVLTIPSPPTSDTGKSRIRFTIVDRNATITVNSMTVTNCIQVKREYIFTQSNGTDVTLGSGDFYYGKNKGFLKAVATSPAVTSDAIRWVIR